MNAYPVTLVDSIDDYIDVIDWLRNRHDYITIDTETTGLSFKKDKIRLVQLGCADRAFVIPFEEHKFLIKELLSRWQYSFVMHNQMYDTTMLAEAGIYLPASRIYCTKTMAHLNDPLGNTSLKPLSLQYAPGLIKGQADFQEVLKKNKWTWATVPITEPTYWLYGGIDTIITAKLYDALRHEVSPKMVKLEQGSQAALIVMMRKGFGIDTKYLINLDSKLEKYLLDIEAWCLTVYGIPITSQKMVTAKLIEAGVPMTKRTPTRKVSMSEEALAKMQHPLAQAYIGRKKSMKIKNSIIKNLLDNTDFDTKRVHYWINPNGAVTGRMSMTPNLQNVTKDVEVRKAFVPEENNKLVCVDYKLAELCVFAHYSQDESLIEACYSEDVHMTMASRIWPNKEITKPLRDDAKRMTFGILYGAGAKAIAKNIEVPLAQARRLLLSYYRAFPKFKSYFQQVISEATELEDGMRQVVTYTGRKQMAAEEDSYKLINYLVQGTTADILKMGLVNLYNSDLRDYMVIPVHDEVIFDVPAKDAVEVSKESERLMTYHGHEPNVLAEAEIMSNWGESVG